MCPFSILMNEFVYFSSPGVRIWGFSSFSKTFEKIEVFAQCGPEDLFWLNSLMCPFSIQMSEFVYFSCPGVRIWEFFSFSECSQKIEKIEVFAHCGPGELFWLNSLMCPFSIQMSEFVYFSCPGVSIWGFSSFSETFQKIEKIEVFAHRGTWGTFFAQFTHVPIFHPNEWICIFKLSWRENMRIFFIFKNFSKNRKYWSFRRQRSWRTFLPQFTHVPIFHPNEWICIF